MQKETRRNSAAGSAKPNPPRKLTRAEKKQIAEIIRQAKGDGKAHTAQQTIPYIQMYPDGICKVTGRKYSKTVAFEDINYQLAQADDKTAIFENWCDFLNYFDASVSVQLSFINQGTQRGEAEKAVNIPAQEDAFNSIRTEYRDMLKNQLAKGNNGLVKAKYITFAIEADSLGAAKSRLARIETDVLNNFKLLGVSARPMTGYERLKMLHGIFHPEGGQFAFDFSWLAPSGLSTKDFIAPSSFRFGEGRYFRMGRKIGAVSFLEILAPELNDRILSDILDLETGVIVNLHIHSIDQTEAIKTIKRKITDLDKMKIEEQKKAVRSGYDMDIIPSDLATFGSEAKNLLQDLQSRNERMFLLTFLVVNMADTKRKLENDVFAAAGIAQKNNCALTRLDYQQEAGLMSSVPLGENLIPIQRGLTTSSTAIFIPFITQELFQTGAALYYGLNALSNNMILCDRKQLKNPNGLILGTPGSGKSFAAKREMTNAFLITDDDIIICDPEAEYFSLVQRLDGQVIRLSPTGKGIDGKPQYVNPMDINLNYSEDDSPLALKSDFILSLCELVIGGKEGLQPVDKTVIDRAVRNVYRPFLADPDPEKMPILGDLYNELLKQPEPEAARIAAALELYVSGSLNVFNHRTNVELSNRLVCFDIKQLGKQLKKLGISWCVGHLVQLAEAAAYGEQYKKWSFDSLPILPEEWQYAVDPDKGKQFKTIKELMHRADVSEVVNACDAGREGELIFRFVYEVAGCKKPMEQTSDRVLAYAIELTGTERGKIKGNLYELDYAKHYERVKEKELPADTVKLIYEHGEREIPAGQFFNGNPDYELGKFERFEAVPNDPDALQSLLQEERRSREQLPPGDFKAHIAALRDGLIETEARRIVWEMKRHDTPNSPNKTHFMVELSPAFMQLAATKDTDRLFSMLPYKTLAFSKIEGRHGTYALIDKGENRDRKIRKPRPSIRAQLKADKAKTAPKKAAAKTKNHDMEV